MNTLAYISVLGLVFGLTQPQIAQVTPLEPFSNSAQLGVCGACLGLLLIVVTRTIPQMAKISSDAVKEAAIINARAAEGLKVELHGLRSDVADGQDATISLLREAIFNNKQP
jgi:hypothetical protein